MLPASANSGAPAHEGGGSFAGLVTDANGRPPAAPLTVRAVPFKFRFDNFDGPAAVDVDATLDAKRPGAFRIAALAAGTYDIVAESADHHVGILKSQRLAANERLEDLRIVLGKETAPHYVTPYEAETQELRDLIDEKRRHK